MKSYFNQLQLNIKSYVDMYIIIFLKIKTSLNIEHKLHMNNQVSDADSGEPLVLKIFKTMNSSTQVLLIACCLLIYALIVK